MTNMHRKLEPEERNNINNEALKKRIVELEEAVRESEEKYHYLFDHALFPISITDAKTGKLISYNKSLHEIHGYSFEEFKKLNCTDLEFRSVFYQDGWFQFKCRVIQWISCSGNYVPVSFLIKFYTC